MSKSCYNRWGYCYKKILIIIAAILVILAATVLVIGPDTVLDKVKQTDFVNLKCTVTFTGDVAVSDLEEFEQKYKVTIEGIELKLTDKNGEKATSLVTFNGYENLKNEISNIADRIDVHDICISGAYIIAKNSTIEELKSEDFVYSAESVLSVPQSKQSFGSYPQTKTWGIEE